jgi:hypothetical protein
MSLRLETDGQRNLDKRHRGVMQQFFGALNSSSQKKLMRSKTRCRPELRGEVHPAQSRDPSEI